MPQKRTLDLEKYEQETLLAMRDHHPKPHMRERAAALLKIASGRSINWVAQHGLLRPRDWGTVAEWLNNYEQAGLGGLYIEEGRGRPSAVEP